MVQLVGMTVVFWSFPNPISKDTRLKHDQTDHLSSTCQPQHETRVRTAHWSFSQVVSKVLELHIVNDKQWSGCGWIEFYDLLLFIVNRGWFRMLYTVTWWSYEIEMTTTAPQNVRDREKKNWSKAKPWASTEGTVNGKHICICINALWSSDHSKHFRELYSTC